MADIKFSQFPDSPAESGAVVVGLNAAGDNVKFDFSSGPSDAPTQEYVHNVTDSGGGGDFLADLNAGPQIVTMSADDLMFTYYNDTATRRYVGPKGNTLGAGGDYVVLAGDVPVIADGATGGLQPGDNVSELVNDVPYLDQAAADLLYATLAQGALADTALQPSDNVSELTNDANYKSYDASNTLPDPAGYPEGFLYMVTE